MDFAEGLFKEAGQGKQQWATATAMENHRFWWENHYVRVCVCVYVEEIQCMYIVYVYIYIYIYIRIDIKYV